MSSNKLVVIGQGYVGLPVAMRAVATGWHVIGVEVDADRAARLAAGDSYVEDVPSAELAGALASGRYEPTVDYARAEGFDVAVVSVPTPLREGAPDLSYIVDAAERLAPLIRLGATVILESTTYPGTTEELFGPLLTAGSGLRPGVDFHLGYSPERIDPGNRTWNLVNTPKVVSGTGPRSLAAVTAFYDSLVERTVAVGSTRTAELTKLLENTFRHVNIALVNELAMFAHELGVDVWEAIDAASTKPFGYLRFTPGPGAGGHCLPIDPSYLSWRVRRSLGRSFRFVELANDINDHMPDHVVRRVTEMLNARHRSVAGSRILLLGLAYKANTGDAREAPATRVAGLLADLGAELRAADPHVDPTRLPARLMLVDPTPAELAAADLVVVLVDHDAFDRDAVARHARLVLDTRRWLPGPHDARRPAAAGAPTPDPAGHAGTSRAWVPAQSPRREGVALAVESL
ncbi:UDP-N-acetyl-D-glucosamine 6-dehydrogenase [Frankia canadensis]|uniref:UDP-N-acetyl-D-glucosamine 6-dehydrogenase n=1 Tax=Frankia canadensis TaxID=1836972 RepID=A0A2I2KQA4_9ACTN|nr:nucleotide sugar dehydrogenase [Frankia canadensis]SNQ47853.1 UDP-N-acetyl-D-glucosamine 6-dehydrogenase [Frankia canadensis]SOU55143.1 UDP-N-acetyl-D-glucosamine 6-dehydrogenase [Frankia canadensis]